MSMEMLPINKHSGQSYGYILYATKISKGAKKVYIYDAVDRVTVSAFENIFFRFICFKIAAHFAMHKRLITGNRLQRYIDGTSTLSKDGIDFT